MEKPKLVLCGPIGTRSGYGNHCREIATALINSDKYDVSIIPLRWGTTPQTGLEQSNESHVKIKNRIVAGIDQNNKPDIFIHLTIPNEFQAVGKYNIGITAGIETTLCAPSWIEGCNRMDLVITTSEHSKKVFLESKFEKRDKDTNAVIGSLELTTPVEVLFEGVDLSMFSRKHEKTNVTAEINSIPSDFAFLFVGHWLQGNLGHDRKDVGTLIMLFLETFKRKSPKNFPALILKTSGAGFSEVEKYAIEDKIYQIQNMVRANGWGEKPLPPIYLLYGNFSDSQMNELYNHEKVKAMVSLTKGEGFGKPLLEFMTTGKPVIASGWSGQLDFLNPDYSVILPGELKRVDQSSVNDWILSESQWFFVNHNAAMSAMSNVYENYKIHLERSNKSVKAVRTHFSLDAMQEKLTTLIESYSANKKVDAPAILKLPTLRKV